MLALFCYFQDTVDLSYSVKVERRALLLCCHKNYSKLTMDLMVLVFTKDELANCSLTGKMSNAHGGHVTKLKPALDAFKVRAIVGKSVFIVMYQSVILIDNSEFNKNYINTLNILLLNNAKNILLVF